MTTQPDQTEYAEGSVHGSWVTLAARWTLLVLAPVFVLAFLIIWLAGRAL